jgi:hypothetical protein
MFLSFYLNPTTKQKTNCVAISLITDSLSSKMSQKITQKTASFVSCFYGITASGEIFDEKKKWETKEN